MMACRSVLRPDQLDVNGSYQFAQLTIDGYSGGDLQDGYLTGLILEDAYGGTGTTIEMHADDGEINQIGTGQVTFAGNVDATDGLDVTGDDLTVSLNADITGNVHIGGNTVMDGDLLVQGTTTTIDTEQMIVQDPITIINADGSEATSHFTGFSARDDDGYNRIGWVFEEGGTDGYWGLSTVYSPVTHPDAVPDRAIAYIGEGDAYGDLSSTEIGDSGASKIGVDDSGVVEGDDVQEALENLFGNTADLTGTPSETWTVNNDAYAALDEDACLILAGGDGTSLMEGYLCLITDSVGGTRLEYKVFDDGAHYDREFHLGPSGDTSDVDACLILNAGDGGSATSASICLDGTEDRVNYTGSSHYFDGYVRFGDDVLIDGSVTFGDDPTDCINFGGRVCTDILPMVDDAYDFGSESLRWQDGYFVNLDATTIDATTVNATTVNATDINTTDLTVTGETVFDGCVVFNGDVCSDILPAVDDAYDIGSETQRWQDGYFVNLDATTVNATTVNATDVNTTDLTATGDVSVGDDLTVTGETTFDGCVTFNGGVCSDVIPAVDDAYDIGSETNRWQDGYFVNLDTDNLTVNDSITLNGDVILGDDPTDCIVFNGRVCSDILPITDDAYDIGSDSLRWQDGYFVDMDVEANLVVDGYTTLGDTSDDHLVVNATIYSDLNPEDCSHQLGDPTHRWLDGYFCMPTFDNITPIGNDDSLIGVLKGIDDALADATVDHPRGVWRITIAEAIADALNTSTAPEQGDQVDVGDVGITDAIFQDKFYVYWNGQLLWNDPTTAANKAAVQNDVARQTANNSILLFSGNLRRNAVIQIVDLR